MTLPLNLEQFGIDSPRSAILAVEAETLTAEASRPASREFDLERWVRNTLGGLKQLREAAEGGMKELGTAISSLEELEAGVSEIRAKASSLKRRAETTRSLAVGRRGTGRRGVVQSLTEWVSRADRWLSAAGTLLPEIRDTRWAIMAIRAEREEAGDAPAFEDAKELIAFLES